MIIGEVIKKYRLKAKLTQQELADKTGLSKSFISHIEREDKIPHLDKLEKLSNALDVPMAIIVFEASDMPQRRKKLEQNLLINNVIHHMASIIKKLDFHHFSNRIENTRPPRKKHKLYYDGPIGQNRKIKNKNSSA